MESKFVNLNSFVEIMNRNDNMIESFLKIHCSEISKSELNHYFLFIQELLPNLSEDKINGYFFGLKIQDSISEEFDILRFSKNSVINIEIKNQIPKEGLESIEYQLSRHNFLLNILDKNDIQLFTYVVQEKKLYHLVDKHLEETNFIYLTSKICSDFKIYNELKNIDSSTLIVSPYVDHEKFKLHKYFLSENQSRVKNAILKSQSKMFSISGGPGTGKTMLLADLYLEYINKYNPIIIFCGIMDDYSSISKNLGVHIIPIKYFNYIDINNYDVILVDEAHRLYKPQFEQLIKNEYEKKIIFSVDHNQTLHKTEKSLNIEKLLNENTNVENHSLTNKIRTNKEMASFIKKLIKINSQNITPYKYKNIYLFHFNDDSSLKKFVSEMNNAYGFKSIELTEYITKTTRITKRKNICIDTLGVHNVIGREYDNVLVIMDKHFSYNSNGDLVSNYDDYYPFDETSSIFQAVTRVRKKLIIVLLNNENLFIDIQRILTWLDDK